MKTKALVLYMFALHGGHIDLFKRCSLEVERLCILGPTFLADYPGHQKIISAVDPYQLAAMIRVLGYFREVEVVELKDCPKLNQLGLVMSDEKASREIAQRHFPCAEVEYVPVFLQWNKERVFSHSAVSYDAAISTEDFHREMLGRAAIEGDKSSDWWRHVGSVLVRNGEIILASHNEHMPSEHTPYILCDPRVFTEAGKNSEICSAIHNEQAIVAEAAKRGIAIEGCDLYITTFPCPVCAKIVAKSGIKRIFFRDGQASLDGQIVLKVYGVELIHVE